MMEATIMETTPTATTVKSTIMKVQSIMEVENA